MVAAQPYFGNIVELVILGYHPGIQMVVVIYNWLLGSIFLIQIDRKVRFQQKILIYHIFTPYKGLVFKLI